MRDHSFDSSNSGLLDKLIWHMRATQVRRALPIRVESLADFGCGYTAPLLRTLLAQGIARQAVGVDLQPDAAAASATLTLVRANLNEVLPLEDARFDAVLSLATLEHLDQPDLHLREIHRTLRPGGRLLLTTPSPRGKPLLEFLAYRVGIIDRHEIEDHRCYYSPAMLVEALVRAGFSPAAIRARTFQLGMNNIVIADKTTD